MSANRDDEGGPHQAAETGAGDNNESSVSSPQHRKNEQSNNQRYSNLISDSQVFLARLRDFKPQSLGCLEARRKSSSTLIFPNPLQACMGPTKCRRYPHGIKPTTGYWIECHGPGTSPQKASSQIAGSFVSTSHRQHSDEDGLALDHRASSIDRVTNVDDHRSINDPASRTSSSAASRHPPAMQKADRFITRHDSDIGMVQDISDEKLKQELIRRFESIDRPESSIGVSQTGANRSTQQESIDIPPAKSKICGTDSCSAQDLVQLSSKSSLVQERRTETPSRNASEKRKRLTKRTVTRDDIDLHKPRRPTPNITITEPSFNQSTTTYQTRSKVISRQDSQGNETRSSGIVDSTIANEPLVIDYGGIFGDENQASTNKGATPLTWSQDNFVSPDVPKESSMQGYKPFRYDQHRPSVINEDADLENECIETRDQPDQCCGLSTTKFTKKTYQEQIQELRNQKLQKQDKPYDPRISNDPYKNTSLELISFEEENYEKYYYEREHWNYFTNDEMLGPVMLSLKQESNNSRDHFHVLLRTVSYTLHGTVPASEICANRYDRDAVVKELSEIAKLKPPLVQGQLPSTPENLLKLDHIFIKTELKVGVIYIKSGQAESEEAILGNKDESPLFAEFLDLLGDRITLRGFDRYKGGLDTVHNLTGTESVYTFWRNIEIMFHVSTMLPHEENDMQKLQKKRHIGNDIVCVAFIESDDTLFWPGCIKSYFLHTFITVRTSPQPLKEGEKRKYHVSCVCRNEVQYAFKPYLLEQDEFFKSDYFREWLLVKIVNGERASYSAPKFARMQDRTRSQLLEEIITNLANHLVTGQEPKPYRRGSWRPIGHIRASSPLDDLKKDLHENFDLLAKDFTDAFSGPSRSMLCDVVFKVKDKDGSYRLLHGVRAIMAIRSKTFLEMLCGLTKPAIGFSSLPNQTSLRDIEMRALSGDFSSETRDSEQKVALAKRGSVGADTVRKVGDKDRRQSMLPNISKSTSQKPNYLTVPSSSNDGSGSSGTSHMIKSAFNRLVSGSWSSWSGRGYKTGPIHIKVDQNKTKVDLNSLAICKEIAKFDAEKLSQREFEIKEFDYEVFKQIIEYIHNGHCKFSYELVPDLLCAAEHYDLPDLTRACFHHAISNMNLRIAFTIMNPVYQSSCFYVTAMQLLEMICRFVEAHGSEFCSRDDYLNLNESVFTNLLSRKTLQIDEIEKFQAMHRWVRHHLLSQNQRKQPSLDEEKFESPGQEPSVQRPEISESEYRHLMLRLNKEVNIKLDKISSADLVKIVLPTKVFSNEKIFDVMSDEIDF